MNLDQLLAGARDSLTVSRVFGEPQERNGVTVIPAARVRGGAGGGGGAEPNEGGGGGFGMVAEPAGAYVIRGERVAWRPAVDVNRIVMGGQIVAIVALLVLRSILKARARSRS